MFRRAVPHPSIPSTPSARTNLHARSTSSQPSHHRQVTHRRGIRGVLPATRTLGGLAIESRNDEGPMGAADSRRVSAGCARVTGLSIRHCGPFSSPRRATLQFGWCLFLIHCRRRDHYFWAEFTTDARKTARFAVLIPTAAGLYWWFIVCRSRFPIWSDFVLLVIPEAVFAAAVVARSVLLTHNAGATLRKSATN
jgi:hypothetical protein